MITEEQLLKIMPKLKPAKARLYLPLLNGAMEEAKINTRLRRAAFLAQVAHESDEFTYMGEVWGPTAQQKKYDPPHPLAAKLGNTQPGDGFRYRGAGPIQLTGRENFQKCGKDLGLDLEGHPELARTPETGFRVAGWYWRTHDLNSLADFGESAFDKITLKINGGFNGKPQRDAYYKRALAVL